MIHQFRPTEVMSNQRRKLAFADNFICAELVEDVHNVIFEEAVAINVSPQP